VKILLHLLDIGDVGCECYVFGLHMICGSASAPLVVVDEVERIREAVELRHKITVVEIGSAVEHDDWCPLPDFPNIQFRSSDRDLTLTRRGASIASTCSD
jgi:hypothetical protein